MDKTLRALGIDFADFVSWGDWNEAKRTLAAIERRSAELILTLTVPAEVTA